MNSGSDATLYIIDKWVVDRIEEFDPFRWNNSEEAERRRKAFSELCLYCNFRGRSEILGDAFDCILGIAASERYLNLAKRSGPTLPLYGPALLLAARHGASEARRFLIHDVDMDALLGNERPAHRLMEIWHLFQSLGCGSFPLSFASMEAVSALRFPPAAMSAGRMPVYALTHAIFYATDFGSGKQEFISGRHFTSLANVLDVLTLRYVGLNDPDVALECAICNIIVQGRMPPSSAMIRRIVAEQIMTAGVIAVPPTDLVVMPPESRHWCEHYHTLLVAGIFFSLAKNMTSEAQPDCQLAVLLCDALASIGNHDFYRGSQILRALLKTEIREQFPHAFDLAAKHIAQFERNDGGYGYYEDEQEILTRQFGEAEARRLLHEDETIRTQSCRRFLELMRAQADSLVMTEHGR